MPGVRAEVILDSVKANRIVRDLEDRLRSLPAALDPGGFTRIRNQLQSLDVDLPVTVDDDAVRALTRRIEESEDSARQLANVTDQVAEDFAVAALKAAGFDREVDEIRAGTLKINTSLAEMGRDLLYGVKQAGLLEQNLEDSARAANRLDSNLDTVNTAGLGPAIAQTQLLAGSLNAASTAGLRTGRNLLIPQVAVRSAAELAGSMSRLRATAITSPDIAQKLGMTQRSVTTIKDFSDGLERSLSPLSNLKEIFVTLGAVTLVSGVVAGFKTVTQAASNLAESTSKANVVFGDSLRQVQATLGPTTQTLLLSERAALEVVSTLGNMFQSMGLTRAEAVKMSPALLQLGSDLASFNNLPVDEALVKLQAGLIGSYEPLRTMGVALTEAMVQAKAFELGLADSNGELTEGAKLQARFALIMEKTKTAQGDVARTATGLANTQRRVQAVYSDLSAEIGQSLVPAQLALLRVAEDLAPAAREIGAAAAEGFGTMADAIEALPSGGLDNLIRQFRILGGSIGPVGPTFTWLEFDEEIVSAKNLLVAVELVDRAMAEGDTASDAFAEGLSFVAREGEVSSEAITRLNNVTDLTPRAMLDAATATLAMAVASGGTKKEVDALRLAIALLNDEVFSAASQNPELMKGVRSRLIDVTNSGLLFVNALRIQSRATREWEADLKSLADQGFVALEAHLRELGPESAAVADEMANNLTLAIDAETILAPISDLPDRMAELAAETEAKSQALRDAINPFEEASEELTISIEQFMKNARTQIEQQAELEGGATMLRALGFENLAAKIEQEGTPALGVLRDFLANPIEAASIEADLASLATEGVEAYAQSLFTQLQAIGVDPETARAIAATIDNPTVRAAFEAATGVLAGVVQPALNASFADLEVPSLQGQMESSLGDMDARALVAALNPVLNASFGSLGIPDLTPQVKRSIARWNSVSIAREVEKALFADVLPVNLFTTGQDSGKTYVAGMQEAIASRKDAIRTTIVGTLDKAIERTSPPKVFYRAGQDSGNAYWDGFMAVAAPKVGFNAKVSGELSGVAAGVPVAAGDTIGGDTYQFYSSDRISEAQATRFMRQAGAVGNLLHKVRR